MVFSRCWPHPEARTCLPWGIVAVEFFLFSHSSYLTSYFWLFKQSGEPIPKRTKGWPWVLVMMLPNGLDVCTQVWYTTDIQLGVRVQCVVSAQVSWPLSYFNIKTTTALGLDHKEPFIFSVPYQCCIEALIQHWALLFTYNLLSGSMLSLVGQTASPPLSQTTGW